ncbi:hypothetical protein SUGI_0839170 [Cryptomeria japonica]|uniref:uncharacterized protein LOC131028579 n=1 Tax=Cryptomeria japonica TaxID=3369 RepID=UPI002414C727|nr:uncharacterized protein LOC131028579 [Cryptomeria japonica]GLJ40647.1 hypothetical protein SUGI_0839170 [Cryptomeria japonica]
MDCSERNSNEIKAKEKPKRRGVWKVLARAGNACSKNLVLLPVKLLCRARKAYVETLLNCKTGQDKAVEVPISFKAHRSGSRREEENLRRLIRMTEIKLQLQMKLEDSGSMATESGPENSVIVARPTFFGALRSSSVGAKHMTIGIAPIDEDSPCYFPGSFKKRWATPLPRSGSCGTTHPAQPPSTL